MEVEEIDGVGRVREEVKEEPAPDRWRARRLELIIIARLKSDENADIS